MTIKATQPLNTQKILAIGGIIGPIIYAIVLTIVGLLRPGYSHISQVMSELGKAEVEKKVPALAKRAPEFGEKALEAFAAPVDRLEA